MILLGQLSYIKFFFLRIKKIFDNFKLKKVLLYLLILFGYFGERSIYCVYVAVATSIWYIGYFTSNCKIETII